MKIMSRLVAESGKLAGWLRGRLWLFNRVSEFVFEGCLCKCTCVQPVQDQVKDRKKQATRQIGPAGSNLEMEIE
jgi:hypothetical protein